MEKNNSWVKVTAGMREDLKTWFTFLQQYNRVTFFRSLQVIPSTHINTGVWCNIRQVMQGVESLVPKFGPRRFFRCLVSPPAISQMSCAAPGDFSLFWDHICIKQRMPCAIFRPPAISENRRGRKMAQNTIGYDHLPILVLR